MKGSIKVIAFAFLFIHLSIFAQKRTLSDPAEVFRNPPESAKPGVLWMWMGSNLSKEGITKDLEALKNTGFNRTTMFCLADVTTPWAGEIGNSPTPEIVPWTEPWWKLVRHAAEDSKRLGMDFGMYNGVGYESSGGTWITPEHSMKEVCWSKQTITGNTQPLQLERPSVNPRANMPFPVFNPGTGLVEKPVIPARQTYYKDIVVLAAPANGIIAKDSIINLTDRMDADGKLDWQAPAGNWAVYRIGYTTMGTLIQPAPWKATGFECDKMSQEGIDFHMDHVIGEIQKHLGDLIGTGFTHVHFDSYEAGIPTWTPLMREEFKNRRGYDLMPYLLTFAGREIDDATETRKFKVDFDATIKDLFRDIYFKTISRKLREANLTFLCEPYGGPWRQEDIMPLIPNVMTEFWTTRGVYTPYLLDPTVAALRKSGQNIIEAEAFTGQPGDSKWNETPSGMKSIGDAAFCAGVNRLVLHRFTQQPWDERYQPGATMGQWGTHFDRTQTWWKEFGAMVQYWQRCQALLQWGRISAENDFDAKTTEGNLMLKSIHRTEGLMEVYFVANVSHTNGSSTCSFKVDGMKPELWNPMTGELRDLPQFTFENGKTVIPLKFVDSESYFIVFRKKATAKSSDNSNFPTQKVVWAIRDSWKVQFDPNWGGPAQSVTFNTLEDWTKRPEPGINHYSGTVIYRTTFDCGITLKSCIYIDLGVVKHVAHVFLNQKDLGIIWTAPWQVKIPAGLLKAKGNQLEIRVTNVWANRLIGDEQEPDDCQWLPGHQGGRFLKAFPDWFIKHEPRPSKGRYCFTTWNYFNKNSPLESSGLMGPVRILSCAF